VISVVAAAPVAVSRSKTGGVSRVSGLFGLSNRSPSWILRVVCRGIDAGRRGLLRTDLRAVLGLANRKLGRGGWLSLHATVLARVHFGATRLFIASRWVRTDVR
jgi:hypothetical protein